jgi:hypothetical protein
MNKPIYALSIKQPWAWLICKGYKDIENRDWFIGRKVASGMVNFTIQLPMRTYVHAGLKPDVFEGQAEYLKERVSNTDWKRDFKGKSLAQICTFGAIIGEVDITACVTESKSPWFVGKYGFVLANPVLYDKPIPCRGQLGFFKPEIKA